MECNSSETRGLQKQNCDLEERKKEAHELSKETNRVFNALSTKQRDFIKLQQLSNDQTSELDQEIKDRTDFLANLTKTRNNLEKHYERLVKLSKHQTINNKIYLETEFH